MDESRVPKGNRQRSDRRDRLSELPDSLILLILSLLEMKDVVRTTILSKRWKDLWTTVPCLDFCGGSDGDSSFIDGALAKWKGDKILNFSIHFWGNSSDFRDWWLFVPIEKQVENLFIELEGVLDPEYCAPQPLNSCSSITKLSLSYCNLEIRENVQWNRLKSLEIVGIDHLSERDMNRILSGAPLLEELKFLYLEIKENLNIRSTSLKMLKIDMFIDKIVDLVAKFVGNSQVLSIWAPNLESLEISGAWYTRCLLNVPSLTNAALGIQKHYCNMLDAPACYIMREEMFRPAFLSLSHVQKLTFTNWWAIEFLLDEMKKENCVLFPKLEMLIFEQVEYYDGIISKKNFLYSSFNKTLQHRYYWNNYRYSLAPNTIFPSLSLSLLQLKTVVITWDVRDASIFAVIEILLENARALEKMVIRLRISDEERYPEEQMHGAYPKEYILALEKVVSMRRASPHVKVIISKI